MRDAALACGDAGGMLAVKAPLDEIQRVINDERLDVVVSNKNAPTQTVLSGSTEAISRAVAAFRARKISVTKLPVAAAFHSPLVAEAAKPFRAALNDVPFKPAQIPVYANTTGEPYPDDEQSARDLLGHQLARPVEFVRMLENMHAAGVRTFVEVGPGARLTGLVKVTLANREHVAFSLDASNGRNGLRDLARTVAQLAALGYHVDLRRWENGDALPEPKQQKMTVLLHGSNYRSPKTSVDPRDAVGRKPVNPNPKSMEPQQTSPPMTTAPPSIPS
jgi:acyl transferase domain-containing protein